MSNVSRREERMIPFDLSGLTTPKRVDKNVEAFCRSLSKIQPQYIDVTPEPWCRQSCCEMNVDRFMQSTGGEKVVGYKLWYLEGKYIEAERHVVHRNEGSLRDLTFNSDGETRILFVPDADSTTGYEERALKVRRGFSLAGKRFAELANGTDHLIRRMSDEESWETMLTYEEWCTGKRMQTCCRASTANPSIERTCPGKPGHASHVKRWAS